MTAADPPFKQGAVPLSQTRALFEKQMAADRQELAERRSPQAAAARKASADAFAALTPAEAKATFLEKFKAAATADAYATDDLIEDGQITRITGEHEAQLTLDGGGKGALVSALPLQANPSTGANQNVDAALRATGDEFVPKAPLAPYVVASDLSDGVDLKAADVTVTPVGPGVADAEPQRVGDSVLWANAAADTDFVVTPTPVGVETFHQIRSEQAPESLPLDLTIPDGGRIVRSQSMPGALEIQNDEGKAVTQISPAIAQDADGANVPASYAIDNDERRVTIQVPHRDRDLRYPILVDPSFKIPEYLWDTGAQGHYPGWAWMSMGGLVPHRAGTGAFGDGIYSWMDGGANYALNDSSIWYFQAPGNSTVAAATFRSSYYAAAARSCLAEGMFNFSIGWESGMTALTNGTDLSTNPYTNCRIGSPGGFAGQERGMTSSTKGSGNAAAMWFMANGFGSVAPSSSLDMAYLNESTVVIEDNAAPTTGTSDLSDLRQDSSMNLIAADSGTGIKRLAIYAEDYPAWNQAEDNYNANFDCTVQYAPRWGCPQYIVRAKQVGNLPVGAHTIHIKVWDAAGNYTDTAFTAQVNNPYPISWTYGGADHSINTQTEAELSLAAIQNSGDANIWSQVAPADKAYITSKLIGTVLPPIQGGTSPSLPDETGDDQIDGVDDDPNDPGSEPRSGGAPANYCKDSTIKRMKIKIPEYLPGLIGDILRLGDAGHVDNTIHWCHGHWKVTQVAPDFHSGVKGIVNREIFWPDGIDDGQGYYYNFKGHGEESGYRYTRRAYFRCSDPSGNVPCPVRWYIRQRVYLHGDGTKHVSPMYTDIEW